MRGVHSGWVYNRLEEAYDGIVDFKVEEEGNTIRFSVCGMHGAGKPI